jgi:predicted AAA+ superfamily ATPase
MLEVSEADIVSRVARDNPWWHGENSYVSVVKDFPKRIYFAAFCDLATDRSVRRAVVLMGPRRVGKTVMLLQLINHVVKNGLSGKRVLYASIDAPIYSQIPLEKFLDFFEEHPAKNQDQYTVVFDEIQYLKNWEVHLKDLVDRYPNIKFIASGSAAAALRLSSVESGAGRFSNFQLPPLSFAEFIEFIGRTDELIDDGPQNHGGFFAKDISQLNSEFINYLNYGGYPEAVLSDAVRRNTDQFVKNDIIDKVLLKDLPALYGIADIQELNRLFAHLAYNTGQEVSLQTLSEKSGRTKPTISRYIEYLESAFLVTKVSRIDNTAKRFQRETHFKTYLTNPSMRAALFSPVEDNDTEVIGHLAEAAVFSQWAHMPRHDDLFYARWNRGEIDMVYLSGVNMAVEWAVEIKWSDRPVSNPGSELRGLAEFIQQGRGKTFRFTTRTQTGVLELGGKFVLYLPTSLYCYAIGKNLTKDLMGQFEGL